MMKKYGHGHNLEILARQAASEFAATQRLEAYNRALRWGARGNYARYCRLKARQWLRNAIFHNTLDEYVEAWHLDYSHVMNAHNHAASVASNSVAYGAAFVRRLVRLHITAPCPPAYAWN